jgi:acyl-CoA synthetase (AMP-forming)/AMP-acid ligase II
MTPDDLAAIDDFVTLVSRRARETPDKPAVVYLGDGEHESDCLTFGALDAQARAVAHRLRAAGREGDRVLLLFESGADFVAAFLGTLYAGAIAVPANPPRPNQDLERLNLIVADAGATTILAPTAVIRLVASATGRWPALASLITMPIEEAITTTAFEPLPSIAPESLAFLQYTSGSTGDPKGVGVSHRNLMHNERVICDAFLHTTDSVVVGWLPLFHDMGLIGNVLQPLYAGFTTVLMPPTTAIQKPMRVIRAVSKYRATSCGGPNFFFDLCVRKFSVEEAERDGPLDLSRWVRAYNGSEPVRAATVEQFSSLYARYGFQRSSFYPCYGLAEATLFVSGERTLRAPDILRLDRAELEKHLVAPASSEAPAHDAVSCGPPALGHRVEIVDAETHQVRPTGSIGEIWVSGGSVAQGYWQKETATARTFRARIQGDDTDFLRTGDLGFMQDNRLYVTGRLKDVIIVQGRNHYPQDIERTVETSHLALKPGCGAAFTVGDDEELCIVHEVKRDALRHVDERDVLQAARSAVARVHALRLAELVLVTPGAVPKTSSGKIRRRACREAFLAGTLRYSDLRGRRRRAVEA